MLNLKAKKHKAKSKDVKLINVPYKATFRVRKKDGSLGRKRFNVVYKNKALNQVDVSRADTVGLDYFNNVNGNKKVHIVKARKHKKGRVE